MDHRWRILSFLVFAHIAHSYATQAVPALLPFIQQEFALKYVQIGLYSSVLFGTSFVVSIPAGWTVDRLGVRRSIFLSLLMTSLFIGLFSIAANFNVILVLALFCGLISPLITPSTSKSVMNWFERTLRSSAMGIKQAGVPLGGFLTAIISPIVASSFGWRSAILGTSWLPLAAGFISLALYKGKTDNDKSLRLLSRCQTRSKDLGSLIRNRNFLLLSITGIFLAGSQFSIISYLTVYLNERLLMTPIIAAWILALFHFGGVVGRPMWGIVSDRIFRGRRKPVIIAICAISTVSYLPLGFSGSSSIVWFFFLGFVLGLSALGWNAIYQTCVAELAGLDRAGVAMGLYLNFARLGIISIPFTFGLIIELTGSYLPGWLLCAAVTGLCTVSIGYLFNESM